MTKKLIFRKEIDFEVESATDERAELTSDKGKMLGINYVEYVEYLNDTAACSKCGKRRKGWVIKSHINITSVMDVEKMIPIGLSEKVGEIIKRLVEEHRNCTFELDFMCDNCVEKTMEMSEEDVAYER